MKIGILTFHAAHNFGSMLQAYALQKYLIDKRCEAIILNLRTKRQLRLYRHPLSLKFPYRRSSLYEAVTSFFNPVWLFHECRRWEIYEDFLKNDLMLSKREYRHWSDLRNHISQLKLDGIITGGDQIWNIRCKDFDDSYLLCGELKGIKKISYSPSFGGRLLSSITKDETDYFKQNLSDYDYISVREESMRQFLSTLLNKKIELVVDPTLLLQAHDYDNLIDDEPLIKGDYLYYYSPIQRPYAEKLAKKIGEYYGIKVVTSFPHVFKNGGMLGYQESGPIEFLNLLKNASLVIGRSFHSVVFSVLFHKDFIAIDGNSDARMSDFLSQLAISERGMITEENYKQITLPKIDFDAIDKKLDVCRSSSDMFLMKALQNMSD